MSGLQSSLIAGDMSESVFFCHCLAYELQKASDGPYKGLETEQGSLWCDPLDFWKG